MITKDQKQAIALKLTEYIGIKGSQNKASKTLKGVSAATINHMVNGKWELIKEDMWRSVAAQISYKDQWQYVETRDFKILNTLLKDAQENSLVFATTGKAGTGKSVAMKLYSQQNKNAFLVQCSEFWNRKTFLQELLTSMGRDSSGYTVSDMMGEIIHYLKRCENPIILIDEADKVSDQILYFFITLYNYLEDHCAIVLCATDHLAKRINRGLKLNKKGYQEIFSRIGRKFIELKGVCTTDVTQICLANGVAEREQIKEVVKDCELDLRRVKRKIHAIKKQQLNGQ